MIDAPVNDPLELFSATTLPAPEPDTTAPSPADKATKWTADRLRALLRARHSPPEWALFEELSNGTGYQSDRRSFDAWAMNLWPSSGHRCIGYEIKVSRADFQHELKDPRKRGALEPVAHEGYFLTSPGLLKPDEVPEGWGLIEPRGDRLIVRKNAMQRQIGALPWAFVAALARRCADPNGLPPVVWRHAGQDLDEAALRVLVDALAGDRLKIAEARAERAAHKLTTEAENATRYYAMVRALEEVTGQHFSNADQLRRDLPALLGGGLSAARRAKLRDLAQDLLALAGDAPAVPLLPGGF